VLWLALSVALLLALAASGYRLQRRIRRRRALAALEGGSRQSALEIDGFSEIEDHLVHRECPCGGLFASLGERSEPDGDRILRIVRVECRRCEERMEFWFDATRAYH
jgi:hypothetical protein